MVNLAWGQCYRQQETTLSFSHTKSPKPVIIFLSTDHQCTRGEIKISRGQYSSFFQDILLNAMPIKQSIVVK